MSEHPMPGEGSTGDAQGQHEENVPDKPTDESPGSDRPQTEKRPEQQIDATGTADDRAPRPGREPSGMPGPKA